jgi:tetratricopeptide (TPR) repeat protein
MEQNTIFANRYRLEHKIGMGGFSEVWRAVDQMADDAVIAVKIYAPERGMDEHGLKQFRREYAVVLNLNHSNLLTARHFDVWEGRPYLVMPLIEGGSLYDKLEKEGSFDEMKAAELMRQISNGLDYLHRNEIMHQDIKPDNVLIGADDTYLLMDFGISARMRSTLRKQTGAAKAMTVAYAPPERFSANPKMVPGGDIFSLGVLVYEMISGDVPWMGTGGASLQTGAAVPELPDTFSAGFRAWVGSMMSPDPSARPSAAEIFKAATAYLNHGSWPEVKSGAVAGGRSARGRETQVMDASMLGSVAGAASGAGSGPVGSGDGEGSRPGAGAGAATMVGAGSAGFGAAGGPGGVGGGNSGAAGGGYSGGGAPTMVHGGGGSGGSVPGGTAGGASGSGNGGGGPMKWIIAAIVLIVVLAGGYFGYTTLQENKSTADTLRMEVATLVARAETLVSREDYDEALTVFQRALDLDPSNTDVVRQITRTNELIRQKSTADLDAERQRIAEEQRLADTQRDQQLAQREAQLREEQDRERRRLQQERDRLDAERREREEEDRRRADADRIRLEEASQMPEATAEPAYGLVRLSTGFTPDPWERVVRVNGVIDLNNLSGSGFITIEPTLNLQFTAGTLPLTIKAEGTDDLLLLIKRPDGEWIFNDDTNGLNPQVVIENPPSGLYNIWVGTHSTGTSSGTLYITEVGSHNGPNPFTDATYGRVSLQSGFTPDPWTRDLLAGGLIDLANFGYAGFVATAPDLVLNYTASERFSLIFKVESEDDTVMLIFAPDGQWYYNDDTNGVNPQVSFTAPQNGDYRIWVGTYSETMSQSKLLITETIR